jgi:hypothetical protein
LTRENSGKDRSKVELYKLLQLAGLGDTWETQHVPCQLVGAGWWAAFGLACETVFACSETAIKSWSLDTFNTFVSLAAAISPNIILNPHRAFCRTIKA